MIDLLSLPRDNSQTQLSLSPLSCDFRAMEAIRVAAGRKMGLGDVTGRVVPKFAIVAEPREPAGGSSIAARYFVPFATHASMAVTGAICIACCSVLRGSVADELSSARSSGSVVGGRSQNRVVIEHPSGRMEILLDCEQQAGTPTPTMAVTRAGVMRTARLIFEGSVHINADGLESFALERRSRESSAERYRQQQRQLQQDFRQLYRLEGSGSEEGDLLTGAGSAEELQRSMNAALGGSRGRVKARFGGKDEPLEEASRWIIRMKSAPNSELRTDRLNDRPP